MKITGVETLQADAGWRMFSFLKVTTSDGIIGCSTISAIVPNFRVMEIDIDSAPWRDEFYTSVPTIDNGDFILPTGPGWGTDVNEKAVRARQPKS